MRGADKGLSLWLWRRFGHAPLRVRLQALLRLWACPWPALLEQLPESGLVIDLGCGLGLLEILGKRMRPELRFVAIDPDPRSVGFAREAAQGAPGVEFRVGEIGALQGMKADMIVQVDSLYLVPEEERGRLVEQVRSLVGGTGLYLLKEIDRHPRWKWLIGMIQELLAVRVLGYTFGRAVLFESCRKMRERLAAAGFQAEIRHLDSGYLHSHTLYLCRPLP